MNIAKCKPCADNGSKYFIQSRDITLMNPQVNECMQRILVKWLSFNVKFQCLAVIYYQVCQSKPEMI